MLLTILGLKAFAFAVWSSACCLDHCCYLRFLCIFPQAASDFRDRVVGKKEDFHKSLLTPLMLLSTTPVEHLSCFTLAVKN